MHKSFTFRISEELRQQLEIIAKNECRTLSNLIVKILTETVENYNKSNSK